MDLEKFLTPPEISAEELAEDSFYRGVELNTAAINDCDLVILGVPEQRGSEDNKGCAGGADGIRKNLADLKKHNEDLKICDVGNLIPGHQLSDTYVALGDIGSYLIGMGKTLIVLGGSQDLCFGQYKAYEQLNRVINITSVDAGFDLGKPNEEISSKSYLGQIILQQPNFLFNYSHIGYQTYLVGQKSVELMQNLNFDTYRLGDVQSDITEAEPVLRNADLVMFDLSVVRHADAPGKNNSSPNGLYAGEYCQLAFYAGSSSKVSSVGFYEYNPLLDQRGQSAMLNAQALWYFLEGYFRRRKDEPLLNENEFWKYKVQLDESRHEIIFFKSKITDRWWMEVPYHENKARYKRHCLLPCSPNDYQQALGNEVPQRWWLAYQKLS